MNSNDAIPIIREIAQALVVVIVAWTAFKVKLIEHSVNSAASRQADKVDALTVKVAALTASLAEEKKTAELLAQQAGPTKRKLP